VSGSAIPAAAVIFSLKTLSVKFGKCAIYSQSSKRFEARTAADKDVDEFPIV
jgi:hypothetical protein